MAGGRPYPASPWVRHAGDGRERRRPEGRRQGHWLQMIRAQRRSSRACRASIPRRSASGVPDGGPRHGLEHSAGRFESVRPGTPDRPQLGSSGLDLEPPPSRPVAQERPAVLGAPSLGRLADRRSVGPLLLVGCCVQPSGRCRQGCRAATVVDNARRRLSREPAICARAGAWRASRSAVMRSPVCKQPEQLT